jgi:hypothetical protein
MAGANCVTSAAGTLDSGTQYIKPHVNTGECESMLQGHRSHCTTSATFLLLPMLCASILSPLQSTNTDPYNLVNCMVVTLGTSV